jgi:hypothetical protein
LDPHHFDADHDADPDVDPDLTYHPDADPYAALDSYCFLMRIRMRI